MNTFINEQSLYFSFNTLDNMSISLSSLPFIISVRPDMTQIHIYFNQWLSQYRTNLTNLNHTWDNFSLNIDLSTLLGNGLNTTHFVYLDLRNSFPSYIYNIPNMLLHSSNRVNNNLTFFESRTNLVSQFNMDYSLIQHVYGLFINSAFSHIVTLGLTTLLGIMLLTLINSNNTNSLSNRLIGFLHRYITYISNRSNLNYNSIITRIFNSRLPLYILLLGSLPGAYAFDFNGTTYDTENVFNILILLFGIVLNIIIFTLGMPWNYEIWCLSFSFQNLLLGFITYLLSSFITLDSLNYFIGKLFYWLVPLVIHVLLMRFGLQITAPRLAIAARVTNIRYYNVITQLTVFGLLILYLLLYIKALIWLFLLCF